MAGPHRKPQPDTYTALLAIAFVAILLAILFMYLETADYGSNKYTGAPPVARLDLPAAPTGHVVAHCGTCGAVDPTAGFRLAADPQPVIRNL